MECERPCEHLAGCHRAGLERLRTVTSSPLIAHPCGAGNRKEARVSPHLLRLNSLCTLSRYRSSDFFNRVGQPVESLEQMRLALVVLTAAVFAQ